MNPWTRATRLMLRLVLTTQGDQVPPPKVGHATFCAEADLKAAATERAVTAARVTNIADQQHQALHRFVVLWSMCK